MQKVFLPLRLITFHTILVWLNITMFMSRRNSSRCAKVFVVVERMKFENDLLSNKMLTGIACELTNESLMQIFPYRKKDAANCTFINISNLHKCLCGNK